MRKVVLYLISLVALCACHKAMNSAPEFTSVVFAKGDSGFDTYRIPAIVCTADGGLLAFAEARKNDRSDAGDIDLVVRRSEDGGRTWGKIITVWDDSDNTCGNPAPVVDSRSGRIILPMTWNKGCDKEVDIQRRTSEDTRRVFLTYSDDNGLTWAPVREITSEVKDSSWTWYATGPCHSIQLVNSPHAGRIVVPCNHGVFGSGTVSFVLFSDDGGETWTIGGTPDVGNEATVAELKDGSLMLNMRNGGCRLVAISHDGGETFSESYADSTLVEPRCQASLVGYAPKGKPTGTLFFSNPAHSTKRVEMTVKRSDDDGATWHTAFELGSVPAAYSDLVVLPDGSLGLLYETGEDSPYDTITFCRWSKHSVRVSGRYCSSAI